MLKALYSTTGSSLVAPSSGEGAAESDLSEEHSRTFQPLALCSGMGTPSNLSGYHVACVKEPLSLLGPLS